MNRWLEPRQIGKSLINKELLECAKQLGTLISDNDVNGLRQELYEMPTGERWMFVSKVPKESDAAKAKV